MRATRAYLAGFGTSGSLLAGAALMFLLASAFVAFQGWPQVGGGSSPVLVSVPQVNAAGATRASRVLSATTAKTTHPGAAGAGHAAKGHGGFGQLNPAQAHHGTGQTTLTPVSTDPGTSSHHASGHHSTGPVPTPRPCTLNCGPIPGGQSGPVRRAQKVVSGATRSANSTVSGTVTTIEKVLPGSKGTSSTVGGVVTTVTNVVKGATGGLP